MIWAREHDCPWNELTCAAAAQEGHLDILIWAREHHRPWCEKNVRIRRCGREPGGVEVGAAARLPVGRADD